MKFYCVVLGLLFSAQAQAQAFEWSDLWLNDYQKAQKLLKDNPAEAATTFRDPEWQGIAKYNAGSYKEAAERFSELENVASEYNLGNALARAGDLETSLEAYKKLLEKPDLPNQLREDTVFNRDLVKKLMQQQDQQQSEQNSDESSESGEKQESQDSDQEGQQGQDQNDAEKNESNQQEGEPSKEEQDKQESTNNEQQQADKNENQGNEEKQAEQQAEQQAKANQDQPMTEDQQATEQWLRQIPDDPSGLLRRKLVQSHRTKYPEVQNGGQAW